MSLLVALAGIAALAAGVAGAPSVAVVFGVAGVGLFLLVGTGILPHALAEDLQRPFSTMLPAPEGFGSAINIVLLGEGTVADPRTTQRTPSWIAGPRLLAAASLHRAALAGGARSRLIIAGERTRADPSAPPGAYARALAALGVNETDIVQDVEGLNTYAHARSIARLLKAGPIGDVYLVTSALHMKRALLYFESFGLRPRAFPSDYVHVPRLILPLGYNFAVADIALHQYIGILRFHCYERLGLNRRLPP